MKQFNQFIFISLFCLSLSQTLAQIPLPPRPMQDTIALEEGKYEPIDDTSSYELNPLTPAQIEKYQGDSRYYYKRKGVKEPKQKKESFIDKQLRRFSRWVQKNLRINISPEFLEATKWVILCILFGLVGYFVARAFGLKLNFRKKKTIEMDSPEFEELEKNLEEVDFDELIASAIKNRSYRVAVRLLFLKNLQTLAKQEIIEWEIDKTNNEYKYELPASMRQSFEEMVYLFEHIWYGHFEVEEQRFKQVIREFRDFENQLS